MARPIKPSEKRKIHTVSFRLTEAEFSQLSDAAASANLRLGDFVRVTALSKSSRVIIKTYARNDPAFLQRLHRIGLNLNQLVHNAHIFGRVSPNVAELCEQIAAMITEAACNEE
jgi:hypothetical protein